MIKSLGNWFATKFFDTSTQTSGSAEAILRKISEQQRSTSGVYVDPDIAMRFSTVWSCIRLLSDTVAQMPCKLYREKNGLTEVQYNNPIHKAISIMPSNGITAFDFWKHFIMELLLRGYSVAKKIDSDSIFQLTPLPVKKITRTITGEYEFEYNDRNGSRQVLAQKDAFFCFYALDDDLLPISPITAQANAIGLGIRAERHGAKTLAANATPAGVLELPGVLDRKVKESIKESWDAAYGADGSGGIAVLEGGSKFHEISMSNEDAQLLQTRQFQKQEICGIYGVPPHLISDTAQAKGWSTMEQLMTEFVTLSITPLTVRTEQSISAHILTGRRMDGMYAKFSTNGLLRGDIRTRTSFYQVGIDKGFLTPNEVRSFEDMNPLTGKINE